MMDRIRTVLLTQYIGAILIGLLLADGFTRLITAVVQPLTMYLTDRTRHVYGSGLGQIPWDVAVIPQVISAILYFVIAYLLVRWLYLRQEVSAVLPTEDHKLEDQ